ncbi:hypothetical protein E4U55_000340 [Claviceps digitariae]|nr:hypothetical protein E4U55_000340 [Claviceps digitariae]
MQLSSLVINIILASAAAADSAAAVDSADRHPWPYRPVSPCVKTCSSQTIQCELPCTFSDAACMDKCKRANKACLGRCGHQ